MAKVTSGKVLTRSTKKVVQDLDSGELQLYPTLIKARDELRIVYDDCGKNKAKLRENGEFNSYEERFKNLLNYAEVRARRLSSGDNEESLLDFQKGLEKMCAQIEKDSMKKEKRGQLGKLVSTVDDEKINVPSSKKIRDMYPSTVTLRGCYEVFDSILRTITPQNRRNGYGVFLGVYQVFQDIIKRSEREEKGIDLSEDRERGLALLEKAEAFYSGKVDLRTQIRNNARCVLTLE